MDRNKNLMDKTAGAITDAAQTVTDRLKSAGEAVADAITPKPIRAGDKLIVPSTDPSMPPVIVPAKTRARRPAARKSAASSTRRSKTAKTRTASGKRPSKSRTSRPTTARKAKATAKPAATRKTARRPARKTAGKRAGKTARR